MGTTFDSLCDSCTNVGCIFQSGIVRKECAFYMPPHIEPDNCGNYVIQEPILDKIRAEIMQLDYDIEDVDYDYNDMTQTEVVHMICREEVLRIINKYKGESEE